MSNLKKILEKHGVKISASENNLDLVKELVVHNIDCIIEELELLHRTEGEGLPKRDYDNATDEAIDSRIYFWQQIRENMVK